MNPNYNHTITVFNCLRAADNPNSTKDIWQKHTISGCYYKNKIGTLESDTGIKMANAYTVRIPENKKYKPYREWSKLEDEERKKFFTVSLRDIVVKGECEDNISGSSPNTSTEVLSRNKPESFVVTAFSDNTSMQNSKHYRIGG